LVLDDDKEEHSLAVLVELMAAAPRLVYRNPSIATRWFSVLLNEWDSEPEEPRQFAEAQSARQVLAAALEAREIHRRTSAVIAKGNIDLAWNRVHQDLEHLAPQLQDPHARNICINTALACSSFRPRWASPQQAVNSMAALLVASNCWQGQEGDIGARQSMQLVPHSAKARRPEACVYSVHLHAFHLREASIILARLGQVEVQPSQLILTCPDPHSCASALSRQLEQFKNTRIELVGVANRGRNIGALMAIADRLQTEILMHLHTKDTSRADHTHFIHHWMEYLISTLMTPLPAVVESMQEVAAVAAYPIDPHRRQLGSNAQGVQDLLNQYQESKGSVPSTHVRAADAAVFPMGMMLALDRRFLIDELVPLFKRIKPNTYEEPLNANGTSLHALERAIPLIAALGQERILLLEPRKGLSR